MIVTVTLNAAIDRTLTVPNFQRGQRHRASSGLALAGGKGINVARALKALGVPVVATGPRRRRRPGRGSSRSSPARRSSTTSCASTASRARRPRSSTRPAARTPRSTSGARPCGRRSSRRCSRSSTTSRRAPSSSSSPARCRATSRTTSTPRRSTTSRRKGIPAALDCDGEPLRLGVEAEPLLVSPNQREAEARRRPGVPRRRGLRARARPDRRAAARAT